MLHWLVLGERFRFRVKYKHYKPVEWQAFILLSRHCIQETRETVVAFPPQPFSNLDHLKKNV